ncbi:AMP-binding protein [Tianweitania sp. BSSL-BM11]|uniref:AMP-binding protein n=2 Tax=Tianweitania aestuarii TaxID=2814886 RepID=A0ABS5RTW1_9HYPH|nr:AMP-binding protein [Tianweitania aestuarii]
MGGNETLTYEDVVSRFSADELAATLQGDLEHGINACVECCDRHVGSNRLALDYENQDGRREQFSFEDLRDRAAQFANYLQSVGIGAGDVVAGMLPRTPDLLTTILGTWRAGAIYQPLFTAFGPKAIDHRLKMSEAKLVVTDAVNRPKLADIADTPRVGVFLRAEKGETVGAGDDDLGAMLAKQSADFSPVMRRGDDLMMMMSTSGTTGLPKGVPVPIHALLSFDVYMRTAIDLQPDDVFWNIADPGWAYGLYYAVTGPLLIGHATTFYDGPFTAESTYRLIQSHGINNLAGAPTAFRLLIAAGEDAAAPLKGKLRVVSSAGEPLNPEVIRWFAANLGAPIYDHYGQTETGMVVNSHHGLSHDVRPGAAGLPMPGFHVTVIGEDNTELPPNTPGDLAVDLSRSPLMWFDGYYRQNTPSIADGFYRTGDTAERAASGHISFVGRNDDVITSSGYRIGPFDVESALVEHPAVVEAVVIGKPDPERTEIVKAFIVLKPGVASDGLADELSTFVKKRLSAHAYPREIEFVTELPKTPSGKVQRFILRNREKEPVPPAA